MPYVTQEAKDRILRVIKADGPCSVRHVLCYLSANSILCRRDVLFTLNALRVNAVQEGLIFTQDDDGEIVELA